ncbi:MAG: HEAT repeat domain-containing protein, partial [Acidobacteriota bacterium]|nr:HEAT repeat domain-containing protein [Acidobacteriota bacterium]
LSDEQRQPEVLPSCLSRRRDLVPRLLEKPGITRSWGFLLAARFPGAVDHQAISNALQDLRRPAALGPVIRVLSATRDPEINKATIDFYLRRPLEDRVALAPVFAERRDELFAAMSERDDIDVEDRLVLRAVLGGNAREIAAGILSLSPLPRLEVVSQLTDRAEILRLLPWDEWLSEHPDSWAELVCKAAVDSDLHELLPILRRLLTEHRQTYVVRALGELRDRESVPPLISLLENEDTPRRLEPIIIECLGSIGGPEARKALRDLASSENEITARLSHKALANCAASEDDAFFRDAASHADWYVRLAAAEVLGRFICPENLDALSKLAADPVSIVARRSLTALREEDTAA